jgi:hypothetical protein
VELQNPWKAAEWKGDWCDGSEKWNTLKANWDGTFSENVFVDKEEATE